MTGAKTANSRVFIIKGGASPIHAPGYHSCLRLTGLSQGLGDIEKIECPDPYQYGAFIEIGEIRGAKERVATSLEGRYAMDMISILRKYAREGCPVDIQLHFGACQDPSVFDKFDKAIILEGASLTNYGTDDLGALASGDNASINETSDVSALDAYEVAPLTIGRAAESLITNPVADVRICEGISCGDCATENSGCDFAIAVTTGAGGSPATVPDLIFNLGANSGGTWYVYDINTLTVVANSLDCLGDYVVVVSNAYGGYTYVSKAEFTGLISPTWVGVATGFAGGAPNWIDSYGSGAFIVGANGYIYLLTDPTLGVTVLDAGTVALGDNLLHVHAYNESTAVAVGNNGVVVYTLDGVTWQDATRPVGIGVSLNTVWCKSETEWWVGSSAGNMYYTLDSGAHWTVKPFSGSNAGSVTDIAFSTESIGYVAHQTAATKGRLLRTYNGGYTWVVVPEKTGTIPAVDKFNHIAVCSYDPNFVILGGINDIIVPQPDGVLLVGTAT